MQRPTAVAAATRRPAPRFRGLGVVLGVTLTLAACADLPTAPVIPIVATP